MEFSVKGKLVDIDKKEIYPAEVSVKDGKIDSVKKIDEQELNGNKAYIMPGFVDSHCHIESSMLNPIEFGRNALKHGTLASVSDPHEIANVCGKEGLDFMCKYAEKSPMKIFYTLPSCVPAVDFEIAGGVIDAATTSELIKSDKYIGLSEMMNVPGVLYQNRQVIA